MLYKHGGRCVYVERGGGGRREESTVRGMKSADEVGEMSPADEVTDNEISWRIKNMI